MALAANEFASNHSGKNSVRSCVVRNWCYQVIHDAIKKSDEVDLIPRILRGLILHMIDSRFYVPQDILRGKLFKRTDIVRLGTRPAVKHYR